MAQAKRASRFFSAVTGAALAASAVITPFAAAAQDVTPASQTNETVWTPELRELRKAASAARDYAENNYGVGILIHVGEDFPNEHFENADQFAALMVDIFENKYGTPAKAFTRPNPGTANTGLTFHIGHQIHTDANSSEVKSVNQALASIPSVIEQLRLIKEIKAFEVGQLTLENER